MRKNKKAALYVRANDQRQIEYQINKLKELAVIKGYEISSSHIFIDDKSAKNITDRPALSKLLNSYRADFETVLVHNPDRLTRNAEDLFFILLNLQVRGIELHCCERRLGAAL